jgi:hypothetical protein
MTTDGRTKLGNVAVPVLPVPPRQWDDIYQNQLNRTLRLYFDRLTNAFSSILDRNGGKYISFPYGAFQSTVTQTATANTATVMTLNTTDFASSVSIVDGSKIYVTNPGIYNLQWSGQFQNVDTQEHDASVWLRQGNDGGASADVPGSAGLIAIPSSHGGTPGHSINGWNYFVSLQAEDYVQLWWSTVSAQVSIPYLPAQTGPVRPATASLIATLSFVSALP